MVKAHFNWNTANNESRDTLFCSEFVAQAYLRLGLFNSENIPSNVLQWEFSSENWMGEGLGNGAHLENEIYLRDVQRYPAGKCYERPETCECGPQVKGPAHKAPTLPDVSCKTSHTSHSRPPPYPTS